MIFVLDLITQNVQERLSKLTIDETINVLIEEEIKRECIGTDQSNQCTQETFNNDIISSKYDLDNGVIYDIETGETVKEL